MERRPNPMARLLAPLALLLALGALLLVVSSGGGGSGDEDSATSGSGITATETTSEDEGGQEGDDSTTTTTTAEGRGPKWYEVKPGDTLTAIADATGVALEDIERLNDGVDSQSLTVGQRIQLRP